MTGLSHLWLFIEGDMKSKSEHPQRIHRGLSKIFDYDEFDSFRRAEDIKSAVTDTGGSKNINIRWAAAFCNVVDGLVQGSSVVLFSTFFYVLWYPVHRLGVNNVWSEPVCRLFIPQKFIGNLSWTHQCGNIITQHPKINASPNLNTPYTKIKDAQVMGL